ncbi:MAG: hypothetical protein ACK5OW_00465 [bacterium]
MEEAANILIKSIQKPKEANQTLKHKEKAEEIIDAIDNKINKTDKGDESKSIKNMGKDMGSKNF